MIISSNGKLISGIIGTTIPNSIAKWETDALGNIIYYGIAARGTLDSQPGWLIQKFTIVPDPGVSYYKLSLPNQIWDNRATTVTYE